MSILYVKIQFAIETFKCRWSINIQIVSDWNFKALKHVYAPGSRAISGEDDMDEAGCYHDTGRRRNERQEVGRQIPACLSPGKLCNSLYGNHPYPVLLSLVYFLWSQHLCCKRLLCCGQISQLSILLSVYTAHTSSTPCLTVARWKERLITLISGVRQVSLDWDIVNYQTDSAHIFWLKNKLSCWSTPVPWPSQQKQRKQLRWRGIQWSRLNKRRQPNIWNSERTPDGRCCSPIRGNKSHLRFLSRFFFLSLSFSLSPNNEDLQNFAGSGGWMMMVVVEEKPHWLMAWWELWGLGEGRRRGR